MIRFNEFRPDITYVLHRWRNDKDIIAYSGARLLHYAAERLAADIVFHGLIVRQGETPIRLSMDALMNLILESLQSCEVAHNSRFNTNLAGYRALVSEIANVILHYQDD